MEFVVVPLVALLASALTLFSGFGLGTILMPAFALFFPVEIAVALTAVVHLLNNVFKLALVGKSADRGVVLRFGIPALVAAFAGAWLLISLSQAEPLATYDFIGRPAAVTTVKFVMAAIIACFAVLEILPAFQKWSVDRKWLPLGGALSGFLGGLSGHQGALRSVFLLRCNLEKQAYIATGVVIACMVDVARLSVYGLQFSWSHIEDNAMLLAISVAAAFLGAFGGAKLVNKVTLQGVRLLVAVMLVLIAAALAAGIV